MPAQTVGEGPRVEALVAVVGVAEEKVGSVGGGVLVHLSSMLTQWDWKLCQGVQSRPTVGFHLWKSSGEMPNKLRMDSHDSSSALLNHSMQSLVVSGSY
jgi:hypothetical protein